MRFLRIASLWFFTFFARDGLALTEIQHVIVISIDGGRGDYLKTFIETAPTEFPNLKRLRDMSASTFNARCDYTESITIPDHLCMLTGRPVREAAGLPDGVSHGIISDSPLANDTVHNSGLNPGIYKASIFDLVHDCGLSTALYMGKTRLTICDRSWDAFNGGFDTIGVNNGRKKIDISTIVEASGNTTATPGMVASFVSTIQAGTLKNFTIFQIADTDYAGHSGGWSTSLGSTYRNVMKVADGWVGQIINAVSNNSSLANKVAIILTADHGGGGTSSTSTHTDANLQGNYTIPFFLLAPGINGGSNLYDWFENRGDPGAVNPPYSAAQQPMRNGDVANLSAALLGLPTVPGSLIVPELTKRVNVQRDGENVVVAWPAYLTGWTLVSSNDPAETAWQAVTVDLSDVSGQHVHTLTMPLPERRFFRLRSPVPVGEAAGTQRAAKRLRTASKKGGK